MEETLKKSKKIKTGIVLSDKMDKTITVAVDRLVLHPHFKKYHKRRTKFKAHDEKNQCRVGDSVEIVESRPLSKTKRWAVRKVLERSAL